MPSPEKDISFNEPRRLLSNQEIRAIRLLSKGLSTEEIAKELKISLRTVDRRLSSVFKFFGADNKTDVVVRAHKDGYINLRFDANLFNKTKVIVGGQKVRKHQL